MMNISHDGDRIVMFDENGVMHNFEYDLSHKVLQLYYTYKNTAM